MNDIIKRIENSQKQIISDLVTYLGGSVSRLEMRDLTELYNILDDLLDKNTHYFELLKERMLEKLESS